MLPKVYGAVVSHFRGELVEVDLVPVAWKLTEEPSAAVVVMTAVPVPTLLIWKMYPSDTFLPKVTETTDGLEEVAVGRVALFVNTL
mgnify:CR=1 FL=1